MTNLTGNLKLGIVFEYFFSYKPVNDICKANCQKINKSMR